MGDIFNADVSDYAARCDLVRAHDLALWDVLKYCEREGSLDAAIRQDSMIVNDLAALLKKHRCITKVCLNGGTAAQVFSKHVLPYLPELIARRLNMIRLPSTSPAHAGMHYADKLAVWKNALL